MGSFDFMANQTKSNLRRETKIEFFQFMSERSSKHGTSTHKKQGWKRYLNTKIGILDELEAQKCLPPIQLDSKM